MTEEPRGDRAFFLAEGGDTRSPRLVEEDEEHLRRVLRVEVGDRIVGLDGRGSRIPLEVKRVERKVLVLEAVGAPEREPAPGEPGAPLDWIEVATSLPRGNRGEELVDRLVQVGVASLVPLEADRTQGGRSEPNEKRVARLARIAREACKQSRRSWALEIGVETTFERWLVERERMVLWLAHPTATETLLAAAGRLGPEPRGSRSRPLALAIGPEGGWTERERELARAAGATEVGLGPHVQRIETAAETAVAIVAHVRWARSR
ncbi:MAG: 16S rRNA (uracil(1498)-N(3))-methyltransferase [Planctomycetes bacterium]|nr:16S rRNA (uracil(1498)-N(3))-methyltransferase [Planctomycetota bacterium]